MSDERLTLEQIEELESMEKAATPGPWCRTTDLDGVRVDWRLPNGNEDPRCYRRGGWPIMTAKETQPDDAALIATSRNTLPALIAMAKESLELRAERDALRASNERMEAVLYVLVQDGLQSDSCEYDDVRAMLGTIEKALSTPPVETDEERDERRARAMAEKFFPNYGWHRLSDGWHKQFRQHARAIAESDKLQSAQGESE